jgi:hypothetical protein
MGKGGGEAEGDGRTVQVSTARFFPPTSSQPSSRGGADPSRSTTAVDEGGLVDGEGEVRKERNDRSSSSSA